MADEPVVYERMSPVTLKPLIAGALKAECSDLIGPEEIERLAESLARQPTRVVAAGNDWKILQGGREVGADTRALLLRHAAKAAEPAPHPAVANNRGFGGLGLSFSMPGGRALPTTRRGL